MPRTNSSGDPVEVCGYAYTSDGDSPPAERAGRCAVCGVMTFHSFGLSNTAHPCLASGNRRIVLCARCATDSVRYARAERRFGVLTLLE